MAPQITPRTSGIYRIICTANGKMYIGSSIDLRDRQNEHFRDLKKNTHHSITLQRAFNKYGAGVFIFEILELVLIPETLIPREQYWLNKFKPFGKNGFNIARVAGSTLGLPAPNRGKKMSPEQLERHRLARIGKRPGEATRQRMAKAQTGRKHSEESKEKRRISLLNHPVSAETRARIGAKSVGRIPGADSRAKMSLIGSIRMRTPEEYASRRKTLILISPDGVEHVVIGIHAFCKEHGLDESAIAKVARGKYAHHKGWLARFPEAPSD